MIDLYASPSGTGDGLTPGTPASLAAIKALAKPYSQAARDDVTVWLRGGLYELASPLTFGVADSAHLGNKIRWKAYPGETPTISGAMRITGWEVHDAAKNIWKASATVPDGKWRTFTVNDQNTERVRMTAPSGLTRTTSTSATWTVNNPAMTAWSNPTDVEAVHQGSPWYRNRFKVASMVASGGLVTSYSLNSEGVWGAQQYAGGVATQPVRLEGAVEFLSSATPGAWALNSTTHTIYYVPRAGEDMATADARLALLDQLVVGNGVQDVEFVGVTFAHTTFSWVKPYFIQMQANYYFPDAATFEIDENGLLVNAYSDLPLGAVEFRASKRIRLSGCTVKYVGAAGISFRGNVTDSLIDYADVSFAGSNGIVLGNPNFANDVTNVTVRHSQAYNNGREYEAGVQMFVGLVDKVRVLHNEFAHSPYDGVAWGWGWRADYGWGGDLVFAYNHIYDVMQTLGDGGGFYTLGKVGSAEVPMDIRGNYIHASPRCLAGIYLDNGTNWAAVNENVVADIGNTWIFGNSGSMNFSGSGNFGTGNQSVPGVTKTTITGTDPTAWPAAAQAIVANAGIVPFLDIDPTFAVVGDAVTLAGVRVSGQPVTISAPGATVGPVDTTTDATSWSCTVSGLPFGSTTITATSGSESASMVATYVLPPLAPPPATLGLRGVAPHLLERITAPRAPLGLRGIAPGFALRGTVVAPPPASLGFRAIPPKMLGRILPPKALIGLRGVAPALRVAGTPDGKLMFHDGSGWQVAELLRYDGAAWVPVVFSI